MSSKFGLVFLSHSWNCYKGFCAIIKLSGDEVHSVEVIHHLDRGVPQLVKLQRCSFNGLAKHANKATLLTTKPDVLSNQVVYHLYVLSQIDSTGD